MSNISTQLKEVKIMEKIYSFDYNTIKKNLKEARKEKNKTQDEVAMELNLGSRTTISNWENTNNGFLPSFADMVLLCNYYGVDMDYILGKSKLKTNDIKAISETFSISLENAEKLSKNTFTNHFLDLLLSSEKFKKLMLKIHPLVYTSIFNICLENQFTETAVKKFRRALTNSYQQSLFFNTSPSSFQIELLPELKFESYNSIEEFLNDTYLKIPSNFKTEEFNKKTREQKEFEISLDLAETIIKIEANSRYIDVAKHDIVIQISDIVNDILEKERENFITGNYTGYSET